MACSTIQYLHSFSFPQIDAAPSDAAIIDPQPSPVILILWHTSMHVVMLWYRFGSYRDLLCYIFYGFFSFLLYVLLFEEYHLKLFLLLRSVYFVMRWMLLFVYIVCILYVVAVFEFQVDFQNYKKKKKNLNFCLKNKLPIEIQSITSIFGQ